MNTLASIQKDLKSKGFRSTKLRTAILKILVEAQQPISAMEIMDSLNNMALHPNKTSVYRETDKLLAESVIIEVDLLDGKKRYELHKAGFHHHHIICTKCGAISCIDMDKDLELVERDIEKNTGFKIQSHLLEFFGLCSRCQ